MNYRDYYETLGVPKNADEKAIKNAFRRLARQYHPDTNKGNPEAEAQFKAVNEAYTVLSDKAKRQKYDRFGKDWERFERSGGNPQDFDWSQWGRGGASGGRQRVSQEEFARMMGGQGNFGFSGFFDQLFGAGAPGGGYRTAGASQRPQPRREVEAEITLEEAFHGARRTINAADGRRIQAEIPAGVKTGSRIRLRGSAEPTGGDIYLKIKVQPHSRFSVKDQDLHVKVPVDLYCAVLGGEVPLPTMEGTVQLKIKAGTQPGAKLALTGKGMPDVKKPDARGKLVATVDVKLPRNLSAQEQSLFKQLQDGAA